MKIQLENIGAIRYAELELGKFTVICGLNNSGKTYITYVVYGFLFFWNYIFQIPIDVEIIKNLKDSGVYSISTSDYLLKSSSIINQACHEYKKQLASVFAAQNSKFYESDFKIDISLGDIVVMKKEYAGELSSSNKKTKLTYTKNSNNDVISLTLFSEENKAREIPDDIISQTISDAVKKVVFSSVFPNIFIASAERTGAAIFRRELNFARNKILEAISKKDSEIDPLFLLREGKSDYAWPVNHNVEFVRSIESISRHESDVYINHRELINAFNDILGGDYEISNKDELFFTPYSKSNIKTKLTMDESSSSVRSLLDIGFFIKHSAQFGDLLMIDEPELNLHPKNQRKITRLLANLVNCGINIFVTTHSDYILRELNNLILLNGDRPHLSNIITREGYRKSELLKASELKIYTADESFVMLPNGKRKVKVSTLVPISVDDEYGIHSSSFDDEINDMNRIADDIAFGGQ